MACRSGRSRASGFSIGRPVFRSMPVAQLTGTKLASRRSALRWRDRARRRSRSSAPASAPCACARRSQVREDRCAGSREVPGIARGRLVVPDVFTGLRLQRDDRGDVEIVAATRASGRPGSRECHCRRRCRAGRASGHRPSSPTRCRRRRASTSRPSRSPRPLCRVRRCIGCPGSSGHGIEAPQLLAVVGVIGRDIAAHAHLGAAVADDDPPVDDRGARRDRVGLGRVHRHASTRPPCRCRGRARSRRPSSVPRYRRWPQAAEAAVDDVAARLDARLAGHLRIVLPAAACPDAASIRLHLGPGGRDVDHAVDHQRRGLLSRAVSRSANHARPSVLHVAGVDLRQRRVALLVVGAAVRQPVLGVGGRRSERLRIDRHR